MPTLFNKLNLKHQTEILVLNSPESFEAELAALDGITILRNPQDAQAITFSLAFVTRQSEIDTITSLITAKAKGDAIVWFAYPKGSSKKYTCDFNRDTGWDALGQAGFEGVRQVAIDEDWSAVRFRRVEFIKTMIREATRAMSKQGQARVEKK